MWISDGRKQQRSAKVRADTNHYSTCLYVGVSTSTGRWFWFACICLWRVTRVKDKSERLLRVVRGWLRAGWGPVGPRVGVGGLGSAGSPGEEMGQGYSPPQAARCRLVSHWRTVPTKTASDAKEEGTQR